MSRIIKFRAWDAANGVMIYDQFFIHQLTGLCFYTESLPTYESDGGLGDNVDELLDCGEEEPILMQFTGLNDIDGNEIWEGDVIEYSFDDLRLKATIIFNNYIGSWQYQYKGALGGTPSDMLWNLLSNTRFPKKVKVIGNIYQHPDLLK